MKENIEFDTSILVTYLFCRCLDRIYKGDWFPSSKNWNETYEQFNKEIIEDGHFVYEFLHDYLPSLYDKYRDISLLLLIADYLNCITKLGGESRLFDDFPGILFHLIPGNDLPEFILNLDESGKKYFRYSLDISMLGKTHLFE